MVKLSLKGKDWRLPKIDEDYIVQAVNSYGISGVIATILYNKQIALENIENFLAPKIKNELSNPYNLKDMDKAVERISQAVINNEKTVIFGDYDVDGATASATLRNYFRDIGFNNVDIYIPDRISEGYGLNDKAVEYISEQNYQLMITVDCGITSFEQVQKAQKLGIDVVIIDHHLSAQELPEAIAVVNPNRLDDDSGLGHLCAAGLSFIMAVALNSHLRKIEKQLHSPIKIVSNHQLMQLLALTALGTVCDVMKLTDINRAFVSQGLKIINQFQTPAINAICKTAGVNIPTNQKAADFIDNSFPERQNIISSFSLGFIIGPRINAAGRIDDCSIGANLLANNFSAEETIKIAEKLEEINKKRKEEEQIILQEADEIIKSKLMHDNILLVVGNGWHQGIIGIVASRLKEKYQKPCIILTLTQDDTGAEIGKASGRSIGNIDLGAAIVKAKQSNLLINGGGHKMAVGFTVEKNKISDLRNFLNETLANEYKIFEQDINAFVDATINIASINHDFYQELCKLEPYGNGNSEPIFLINNLRVEKAKILKEKHLQIFFADNEMIGNKNLKKAMLFNYKEIDEGKFIKLIEYQKTKQNLSIICKLKENNWNDYSNIEITLLDVIERP